MPVTPYWRRVRQRFSISAPRMAVRTHLGWPFRAGFAAVLLAIVAGMWWWGFDFGQIFSGFNRKEVEARLVIVEASLAERVEEARVLRARNTELESELAMTRGAQASLEKQTRDLTQENAQIKEELAFLQQLFADSHKQVGLGIQRLAVEREGTDAIRYSALLVRGGSPADEFDGYLTLQAVLVPAAGAPAEARAVSLSIPEEGGEAAPLRLRFKYYQRVEGVIRVPPGLQLRSLTARVFQSGNATPRATRTLTNP